MVEVYSIVRSSRTDFSKIIKRGKYPLYKLLTSQGKMRIMFSEKTGTWQLGFSTSKVIFAEMQSHQAAGVRPTCPFSSNSTLSWIKRS